MKSKSELRDILYKFGKRYTFERELIYQKILEEEGDFTINDIMVDIDKRTVYNIIDTYLDIGILERIPTTEKIYLYRVKNN